MDYKAMGRAAANAGEIRLAPLAALLAEEDGKLHPIDQWYEGFDAAKGHGPYFGTTAQATRDAHQPKGLPSKLREAA